jgi:hypothetical protein
MAKHAHDIAGLKVDPHTPPAKRNRRGQFQLGHTGFGGGRPRGSRAKLSETFIGDLHQAWETYGREALVACATSDPSKFVSIVAAILPRDVDISIDLRVERAQNALEAYRLLKQTPTSELRQIRHAEDD